MAFSAMQSAVVHTGLLIVLRLILTRETNCAAAAGLFQDPAWQNMTSAFSRIISANFPDLMDTPDANSTWLNDVAALDCNECLNAWTFYLRWLPRSLFASVLMVPLQYHWNVWLERCFPARPRDVEVAQRARPDKAFGGDGDDAREEEVVKRWIAQGRVQRSSVSWRNTFLKWLLDLTVGMIWYEVVFRLVQEVLAGETATALEGLKTNIITRWFRSIFSIGPLASLIAFAIIPAERRVTFGAGVDLTEAAFIGAFLRILVPWVIQSEFVQRMLGDLTEVMREGDVPIAKEQRLIDEL